MLLWDCRQILFKIHVLQVVFEGLWSRNTFPNNFPEDEWKTKFSDLVGASHSSDYAFWSYNSQASEGLRDLAENGNTKTIENELKAEVDT